MHELLTASISTASRADQNKLTYFIRLNEFLEKKRVNEFKSNFISLIDIQ